MFKFYSMIHILSALPSAADPNPSNPAKFLPSGPNFGFISGLSGTVSLAIGIALVVVFIIGVILFIKGLAQYRVKDPETGRGAKGLSVLISGVVLMVAAFLAVPFINLIIGMAQSTAPQIH